LTFQVKNAKDEISQIVIFVKNHTLKKDVSVFRTLNEIDEIEQANTVAFLSNSIY